MWIVMFVFICTLANQFKDMMTTKSVDWSSLFQHCLNQNVKYLFTVTFYTSVNFTVLDDCFSRGFSNSML